MPAEWARHECCWMAWPRGEYWGDLDATRRAYTAVAHAVGTFEPVSMVVHPDDTGSARDFLGNDVALLEAPIDDSWARDSGPTFLKHRDGAVAGTAWRFNAWGGKTADYADDAQMASRILRSQGLSVYHSSLSVEGGGLHVDGEGTLLTTESAVLNPNRNPGMTREAAELELRRALGIEQVIWLPGDTDAITDDITDGHIDGIACFARPGVVLYESDTRARGPMREMEERNRRALELAKDAQGRALEILPLEMAQLEGEDGLFCRCYVNFYIANGGIVMPKYGVAGDDPAREVIAAAFPEREIQQVDISAIAPGGGGIHCITQQQPA
jgi:agmatine deiminase